MREVLNSEYGSDGSEAELTRYIYSNHLQSATLELDEAGDVISYEEYHPYGTTAYQAYSSLINATAKRYRYTGKERDEESGLYYHGARYYVSWLGRWTSVDPLESKYAGMSSYNYSFNNPVMFNDPSGADPDDPVLPKGVRNGGVAGGFVGGSTPGLSSNQSTSGKKGVSFDAIRLERKNYDSSLSWVLHLKHFNTMWQPVLLTVYQMGLSFLETFFRQKADLKISEDL